MSVCPVTCRDLDVKLRYGDPHDWYWHCKKYIKKLTQKKNKVMRCGDCIKRNPAVWPQEILKYKILPSVEIGGNIQRPAKNEEPQFYGVYIVCNDGTDTWIADFLHYCHAKIFCDHLYDLIQARHGDRKEEGE